MLQAKNRLRKCGLVFRKINGDKFAVWSNPGKVSRQAEEMDKPKGIYGESGLDPVLSSKDDIQGLLCTRASWKWTMRRSLKFNIKESYLISHFIFCFRNPLCVFLFLGILLVTFATDESHNYTGKL